MQYGGDFNKFVTMWHVCSYQEKLLTRQFMCETDLLAPSATARINVWVDRGFQDVIENDIYYT
jgi:hypothetical protein